MWNNRHGAGIVKTAELSHDTAVYRAATHEQDRIEADGGRITRVRIDAELKQHVARATEKARAEGGTARGRRRAARRRPEAWGSPCRMTACCIPDAQLRN